MAATGYTPISLYYSTTTTVAPTNTNLVNGELAINITDGKLFYKDNAGVVQVIATKNTAAGNADLFKNTGAVATNSTFYVNFIGNNTTSYQGSNTSATLALNPSTGTLYIGTGTALGGLTNPIIAASGNTNNYVQSYIYNANSGVSSSADWVGYTDNSSDAHGWVDIGYTSSGYADTTYTVTGPNEAYVFGSAPSGAGKTGNLVFATDSTGSANAFQWYVGGFTQAKSAWKMQLTSTGLQLANALATAYGGTGNTTGQAASVANALTFGTGLTGTVSTFNGSVAVTVNATGSTINSQTTGYTLVAGDAGKSISITTGGVTIPNAVMSAGNIVTIYNNSASSQTITQGTSLTLQWAGQSSSTTGNRTLGLYGICTVLFISSSVAVISGAGLT